MENIKSVEDIIKRIDIWDSNEVKYRELSGGITNHNYICQVGNKKYCTILRIWPCIWSRARKADCGGRPEWALNRSELYRYRSAHLPARGRT